MYFQTPNIRILGSTYLSYSQFKYPSIARKKKTSHKNIKKRRKE